VIIECVRYSDIWDSIARPFNSYQFLVLVIAMNIQSIELRTPPEYSWTIDFNTRVMYDMAQMSGP
jgi:hypothetical protein